jgi:hypothetical protein
MEFWKGLMEEIFFFMYHFHLDRKSSLTLPINERKWLIERFIMQKEKENEAIELAKRKAKN